MQRVIKPAEKITGSGLLLQSKRLQKQDTTQELYIRVTKDRSHSALTVWHVVDATGPSKQGHVDERAVFIQLCYIKHDYCNALWHVLFNSRLLHIKNYLCFTERAWIIVWMACFCSVLYFGSSTSVTLYFVNTVENKRHSDSENVEPHSALCVHIKD